MAATNFRAGRQFAGANNNQRYPGRVLNTPVTETGIVHNLNFSNFPGDDGEPVDNVKVQLADTDQRGELRFLVGFRDPASRKISAPLVKSFLNLKAGDQIQFTGFPVVGSTNQLTLVTKVTKVKPADVEIPA